MPCYIISYDLRKPGRNYESLYEAIKSYGTWAHILESLWAIVSNKTAVQVRDHLLQYMDSDDGLFVVKSGAEAAWHNVIYKDNTWYQNNL